MVGSIWNFGSICFRRFAIDWQNIFFCSTEQISGLLLDLKDFIRIFKVLSEVMGFSRIRISFNWNCRKSISKRVRPKFGTDYGAYQWIRYDRIFSFSSIFRLGFSCMHMWMFEMLVIYIKFLYFSFHIFLDFILFALNSASANVVWTIRNKKRQKIFILKQ